jgi:hypothetical protein
MHLLRYVALQSAVIYAKTFKLETPVLAQTLKILGYSITGCHVHETPEVTLLGQTA